MEKYQPSESFRYLLNEKAEPVFISDRKSWLEERDILNERLLVCNGNESFYSGTIISTMKAHMISNKFPYLFMTTEAYENTWRGTDWFELIKETGSIFNPLEIHIHPPNNTNVIYHQLVIPNKPLELPYGLPAVLNKKDFGDESQQLPGHFAWINYWDCLLVKNAQLNISLAEKMFYKIEQLQNGDLVIQLTDAELNLEVPEHLTLLKEAYRNFEMVGGRHLLPGHLRQF
ncbi:MAG: DUF5953 family protein [Bacteroidota bacterium]|nr:DUF5953 family protein [Bacteroidota bacterium]